MAVKEKLIMKWHITENGHYQCSYSNKRKDMSIDDMKEILDDYMRTCKKLKKEPYIIFMGGDPLEYYESWKLFALTQSRGIRFGIAGNAFHLNNGVVKQLEKVGCEAFQLSLDGNKETHDKINKPGSYDEIFEALKYFEKSNIETIITLNVSKNNISEIPELLYVLFKSKVKNISFKKSIETDIDQTDILYDEYKVFRYIVWQKCLEQVMNNEDQRFMDYLWDKKQLFGSCQNIELENVNLNESMYSIIVSTDGNVYASELDEKPLGNVLKNTIYDIVKSDVMKQNSEDNKDGQCCRCLMWNYCNNLIGKYKFIKD